MLPSNILTQSAKTKDDVYHLVSVHPGLPEPSYWHTLKQWRWNISCFTLFLIWHIYHKCLPTRTLLWVSFRHIFISLIIFMGIPNAMRILYKTSFLTESQAFLMSIKSWCTASLYSYFARSIWPVQNIWPVVHPLRWNPHSWSPEIASAYVSSLDSRMLVKILYVVNKIDVLL